MLKWLERLLLLSGSTVLLWCALVVADAFVVQRAAHQRLESLRRAAASAPIAARPLSVPRVDLPPPVPAVDEPLVSIVDIVPPREILSATLGELSIPRLNFSAVVFEGTDARTLRFGLGHLETTPRPGDVGNVAIAGHRDSFFRSLNDVHEGDDIWIDTVDERIQYRVSWFRVVDPREVSLLGPTAEPVLTLVTCFPFQFIGQAPYRFVVRATQVQDGGS